MEEIWLLSWLTLNKSVYALRIISDVVGLLTTQVTCARF